MTIHEVYDWSLSQIEQAFLPFSNNEVTILQRTQAVASRGFCFLTGIFVFTCSSPLALIGALWNSKKVEPLQFTNEDRLPNIPIGAATSATQVEGATRGSTWNRAEETNVPPMTDKSHPSIYYLPDPQKLIDHLQSIGLTEYRCSVDWNSLLDEKGNVNQVVLQQHHNLFKKLRENNITIMITLHHFDEPTWFADKYGFEKEENIVHFVQFCELAFKEFSPYVKEWITINEPAVYALQGYDRGVFPPGVKDTRRAAIVLANLLKAHVQVYDALRKLDTNNDHKIGICHNILRYVPYSRFNPIERITCYYLTKKFNDVVMKFFETGHYAFQIPFSANETFDFPNIQDKIDFFGVQYYTDALIKIPPPDLKNMESASTCYPGEKMTHMPYRFYPEGLQTALEQTSNIKKPIYITEVGLDALQEEDQIEFYRKIFQIVDKHPRVEKLFLWSLIDNWEWNYGWLKKFGLLNKDGTQKSAAVWLKNLLDLQRQKKVA